MGFDSSALADLGGHRPTLCMAAKACSEVSGVVFRSRLRLYELVSRFTMARLGHGIIAVQYIRSTPRFEEFLLRFHACPGSARPARNGRHDRRRAVAQRAGLVWVHALCDWVTRDGPPILSRICSTARLALSDSKADLVQHGV
jgi:hypothetical protein